MCESFLLRSKNKDVVVSRSMEFPPKIGFPIDWNACYVTAGTSFNSFVEAQETGINWQSQYRYIGITALNELESVIFGETISIGFWGTFASEGVNEHGLSMSLLTYDADMIWSPGSPQSPFNIYWFLFVDYVLGMYQTVEGLKHDLERGNLNVFGFSGDRVAHNQPCHYIVHDKKGDCLIIEINNGVPVLYDKSYLEQNKLGIFSPTLDDTLYGQMTNAPGLDWHYNNLRQYFHLSPNDPAPPAKSTMVQTSHGSGMIGLPGDYTSPARFIRLSNILLHAPQPDDLQGTFRLANHILNSTTIIEGLVIEQRDHNNPFPHLIVYDETDWVTIKHLPEDTTPTMYYRSYTASPLDDKSMYQALDFNNFPGGLTYRKL